MRRSAGAPGAWLSVRIVRVSQDSEPVPFSPCYWAKSWVQTERPWAPSGRLAVSRSSRARWGRSGRA